MTPIFDSKIDSVSSPPWGSNFDLKNNSTWGQKKSVKMTPKFPTYTHIHHTKNYGYFKNFI